MSSSSDACQYSHDETATVHLYPSSSTTATTSSSPPPLGSRVHLESTSTLRSPTPLFADATSPSSDTGTPFSRQLLELISRYRLQRLLIRVGDASSSSSTSSSLHRNNEDDQQQLQQEERARGPSGTSVVASFVQPSMQRDSISGENSNHVKERYQHQYASLVRYLLDNNLFPPCGAPLDSLRERKHGHSILVSSSRKTSRGGDYVDNNTTQSSAVPVVDVESFLAADAATFCTPGIHSMLLSKGSKLNEGGWGAAANNGACHLSDNWGLFDSLFAPPAGMAVSASSDSVTALSELLLGTSMDASPWEAMNSGDRNGYGRNKRHSIWVDLQASPSCFALGDKECIVTVTRGASYRVALNDDQHKQPVSLGDLLIGHNTLAASLEGQGWKAWYPCPLSDTSRIVMYVPTGYRTELVTAEVGVAIENEGRLEIDVLTAKDGYIDLASPWAQLHRTEEENAKESPAQSVFGISRTVQRPLGVASTGTLVTVLRHDDFTGGQSEIVNVRSLDVLSGLLIKPRMNTLRMVLYQGGGAGSDRFVPPWDVNGNTCDDATNSNSHGKDTAQQCGLVTRTPISLSDLNEHKLTLHSDGTVFVERTINLRPDSSLWMAVDYDEAFLPFQKFPADANRGIDAYPSRAIFTPLSSTTSTTLYSTSLLIMSPVPDMSMPFNVISLSCTLWAFVLGSLLNILVKRGTESIKREFTGEREKKPIDKLKEKLQAKKAKIQEKLGKVKGLFRGKSVAEVSIGEEKKED